MGPKRPKKLTVSAAVLTVGTVSLLTLGGCSGEDAGGGQHHGGGTGHSSPGGSPGVPKPTEPARTGPAPAAVPSVRDWKPVRGPAWKPSRFTRVVADPGGPLADEAKLLASELKVPFSDGPARTADVRLSLDQNLKTGREGYEMASREGKVTIAGAADAGVFYGTRTLLKSVRATGAVADGVVRDRPDRPQRGMMLDIARKHFTADWIEDRIREMGDLKLNQLQLHLSDDQAFRVESSTHPEVVSRPSLTKAQMRRIVKLARSRHIDVIPEIDSPGHLGAVLKAHPEIQLKNAQGRPTEGAVDISDPRAAKIIDDLLREYADLFPGKYWHLGGDEYLALMQRDPEASYPGLAAKAREEFGPGARVSDLATDWLNDRSAVVREKGKTPQAWNDGIHTGGEVRAHRDREVAYWTGREPGERSPVSYLREGWKLINLNDEYLYYVLGEPNKFTYPTGRRIYDNWTPAVLRGTESVPKSLSGPSHILGGRFAVWCDRAGAQTQEQVAAGIRAPLRATAQKLWNPRKPALSWEDFKRLGERTS
ncbi:beta-N-acetylhexosaminidase [Streptomyces marispadix]|uniref:Family 20 glycosylhydrolase n=1 Tax=Streptomyces marispadix TaxID=2922868 RepID=A0ABS9T0Y2_9ACTN|nr:glycoside hydrolase family 20 protein [Streptomyces marispadix]MCH6162191.1 family 20 glycosylhydrolase [Streptomyces marispadix]